MRGDVHGTGSASVGAYAGRLEGDVRASGSVVLLGGTVVAGDVAAATPEEPRLWVLRSRIGGNLVGHGGSMWIEYVDVAGRMALARWGVLELCAGTVGKDLVLASRAGTGELGYSACGDGQGPAIAGSLIAVHVRREVTVQATSVGGDLRCVASPGVVQLSGVSVGGYRDPGCRSR